VGILYFRSPEPLEGVKQFVTPPVQPCGASIFRYYRQETIDQTPPDFSRVVSQLLSTSLAKKVEIETPRD
jgi:hypothetical protein